MKARRRALRRAALLVAAGGWILLVHMLLLAGSAPVMRTATIALPGWPAGTPPLRVALVSDLHMAWPGDTPRRLADTMDGIAALSPDILIVAGDVLSNGSAAYGYTLNESIAAIARVHARLGCYAVRGNHDWPKPVALDLAYRRVGCTLIDNQALRAGPFALIGLEDATRGRPDLAGATRAGFALGGVPVLLTHNPTPIYRLARGVPLALAGHTHCGQVVLPLVGILWHEDGSHRYDCGLVREPDRGLTSVIGAGLGTSNLPIRLGAAPDWWLLTLGPEAPKP